MNVQPRPSAALRPTHLAWSAAIEPEITDLSQAVIQPLKRTLTVRQGENFAGPEGFEVAVLESGIVSLDVTTASGIEFCLRKLRPGDVVIPLDVIESPAFSLAYRGEETARIAWLRNRSSAPSRAVEVERLILTATTELLSACIRMIHELACLPASHRLYCEILRMAGRDSGGGTLSAFTLPTHAALATRLCTTRETISRELSFLRSNGVIAPGKAGVAVLNPEFLLSRLACTLSLPSATDVWGAIGMPTE